MTHSPHISLLFDGGCPLCRREAAYMQRLDKGRGLVELIDIAAPGFDPSPFNRTIDQLMAAMHGRLHDGTMISGVSVFRETYAALGRGWMLGWTAWPGFRWFADKAYVFFAKMRHKARLRDEDCPTGSCAVRFENANADNSQATNSLDQM